MEQSINYDPYRTDLHETFSRGVSLKGKISGLNQIVWKKV